eukprot:767157-Hanusia_phi.AAC.1
MYHSAAVEASTSSMAPSACYNCNCHRRSYIIHTTSFFVSPPILCCSLLAALCRLRPIESLLDPSGP